MEHPLRIGLCGGLVVDDGGRRIEDELSGRQGRELFTYLVLNRGRSVSRDELMALLWPDRAPRSPEAALNTILARLRRALGHAILAPRAQLALDLPPDTWIDIEAAEAAAAGAESMLAEGRAEEALTAARAAAEIVGTRLLPEIQHAWIDQWRGEVEEIHSRLLTVIARAGIAAGGARLIDAERAARRLIERDPFRESGYGLLMEVQHGRGDVAEALLVYERVRTLLRDELGIPPSARLAGLHEKLLTEDPAEPVPAPRSGDRIADRAGDRSADGTHNRTGDQLGEIPLPPVLARSAERRLVGRERELSALRGAWRGLGTGDRRVVAVAGEPGMGKTMLCARLAQEAHGEGAVVLCGHAQEEALVPYAPLVEALRQYVAHTPAHELDGDLGVHLDALGSLVPELGRRSARAVPAGEARLDRMRLYQAFAAWIEQATSRRPVLLVLEDMQWADTDTLLIIRQLLREAIRQPVLALLTYRDGEVEIEHPLSRLLSDLRRDVGVSRVVLRGLGDEEIAALFEVGSRPTAELLRRLREHTSGNPFFVEEIVRSLREGPSQDGGPLPAGAVPLLPDGILDVIQDRLRRLDPPVRDALAAAAVLGNDFSLELLEAVLDGDGADAIDAAVSAGLVLDDTPAAARYRFRHGLTREAIYRGIGRSRRAALHLRAARALEQRADRIEVEPAELAHHLVESGRSDMADAAIGYLREAARRAAAAHAYEDAAEHGRSAIELMQRHRPRDDQLRCALLLELGQVCWQGSGPSARVVFEEAVAVARGLGEQRPFAEATLGLGGRFYAPTGQADEPYIQLLEEALRSVSDDAHLRTRVLGRLAEHLIFVDPARARQLGEEAVHGARTLGDPVLLAATLLSRHATLLHTADVPERLTLATEQVEIARRHGERELEALGRHWLLYDLLETGDVAGAADAVGRLEALAEELDQPLYRHSSLVWRRVLEQIRGDFARAASLAHQALNLARGAQGEAASRHFLTQQLAVARDHGGPERLRQAVGQRALTGDPLWSAAVALLEIDSDRDTAAAAGPARGAFSAEALPDLPRTVFWLTIVAWLAESCARSGDAQRIAVLDELLAPYGDRYVQLTFSGSFGSVHRPLGLLAARRGRPREAAEHLDEAVRRHRRLGAPALEARTLCDYAAEIIAGRARGSDGDAEAMLGRAFALAQGCGAARLAQRSRALTVTAA